MDLLRDSSFGQIVRCISRNRLLWYPEEDPGFDYKKCLRPSSASAKEQERDINQESRIFAEDHEVEAGVVDESPARTIDDVVGPNFELEMKLVDWYSSGRPLNCLNIGEHTGMMSITADDY